MLTHLCLPCLCSTSTEVHTEEQATPHQLHVLTALLCHAVVQDRTIFPLSLMVTRLSGQGQESVFMGVLRYERHRQQTPHCVGQVRKPGVAMLRLLCLKLMLTTGRTPWCVTAGLLKSVPPWCGPGAQ